MAYSFKPVNKTTFVSDSGLAFLEAVASFVSQNGWDVVYNGNGDGYYTLILKSYGTDNNNGLEQPHYLALRFRDLNYNILRVYHLLYADGNGCTINTNVFGTIAYRVWTETYTNYTYRQGIVLDSTNNTVNIYCNEDLLYITVYRPTYPSSLESLYSFKLTTSFFDNMCSIIDDSYSSGTDVVIQLRSGDSLKYNIGDKFPIFSKNNSIVNAIEINAVNYLNDTITLNTVYYSISAGSIIGPANQVFPWATTFINNGGLNQYACFNIRHSACYVNSSNYSDTGVFLSDTRRYTLPYVINSTEYSSGCRKILYDLFYVRGGENMGYCNYQKYCYDIASIDKLLYNRLYIGTSTTVISGTCDTLTDNSKNFAVNELTDKCVAVLDGTSLDDMLHIVSNTSTTITVSGSFTNGVDLTTVYGVFDAGYVAILNPYDTWLNHLLRVV